MLIIRKAIREKINKGAGDTVKVTFHEDTAPRIIKVPADFQALMKEEPPVLSFYKNLSYTHQKEYIQWIESAKRAETRERRRRKALEMMKSKKKSLKC